MISSTTIEINDKESRVHFYSGCKWHLHKWRYSLILLVIISKYKWNQNLPTILKRLYQTLFLRLKQPLPMQSVTVQCMEESSRGCTREVNTPLIAGKF